MSVLTQIKTELSQLGVKPKKTLGQNFLINEGVYQKIVGALELESNDTVVEVGPGLGTLTEFLALSGAKVIAVEKDNRLVDYLKKKFKNQKNVRIIEGDILNFKIESLNLDITNYKVAGNIPYYLTSHLIRTILEDWRMPSTVVLMLQKEVAQRICAKPPRMSLLAVSVQYYAQPQIVSYVSSGNFYPPPDVDSAIIKLVLKDGNAVLRTGEEKFFKVARAGFAGKRKQLGNNLSGGLKLEKSFAEKKLKSIGVDPRRRAETLTLSEWELIANTLLPH